MNTPDCNRHVRPPRLITARVLANEQVCREHKRLILALDRIPDARPGQFLHLAPRTDSETPGRPFLPRAFSIGGLRPGKHEDEVDILYRLVGSATHWMARKRRGEMVSALGPLGRGFELVDAKPIAWLVAGGVGLPPLVWWAEWLHRAGKEAVALCGARSRQMMPLDIVEGAALESGDARRPVLAAGEFARFDTPVILSTDDGSLGFHGTVSAALSAYHESWGGDDLDLVVYCCGPERMMLAVAKWCLARGIECQLCMEREMACGTGTCQSCAVAVRDPSAEDGWRYALCCTEGPVFRADEVIWS